MRKDKVCILGSVTLFAWISMTYFLFVHRPRSVENGYSRLAKLNSIKSRISNFENKLKENIDQNEGFLKHLREFLLKNKSGKQKLDKPVDADKAAKERASEKIVIPVLMFACNRVTVKRALDSLLKIRKDAEKFPIIVSQDCGHKETADVIRGYGDNIIFVEQPDQSDIDVPKKEVKFKGYFKIARHYGWALNETLIRRRYKQVIIVEDDLEFSPDFFEYFEATLPLLRSDPTLWCVSAWNDNGKRGLIDETRPELLYRTDFFGGLGWMITRELWTEELSSKWPKSYWDDWMRQPSQRRERSCIRPEIGRTKTFGKIGVSNGLFFDKHLKHIQLNDQFVPFKSGSIDLSYLEKATFDQDMDRILGKETPVASLSDVKQGSVSHHPAVRIIYRTRESFRSIAKALGIMDDFKSGVPRMAYRGVVTAMFRGQRIYVAPSLNWRGYDPSW